MFHLLQQIARPRVAVGLSLPRRAPLRAALLLGILLLSPVFRADAPAAAPWSPPEGSEAASDDGSADDPGEWMMMVTDPGPAYAKLPEIESRLYGHAYPNQPLTRRLARVERTLFGELQRAKPEARMRAIERQAQEESLRNQRTTRDPMLAYLENKLFQRTFERYLLPDRLHRLETHVFGQSFDALPTDVRLKKLTYALPLVTREIRLSRDDGHPGNSPVIARAVSPFAYASRSTTSRAGAKAPAKTPETHLLSAEGSRISRRDTPLQAVSLQDDTPENRQLAAGQTANPAGVFDSEPVQLDAGAFPGTVPTLRPAASPPSPERPVLAVIPASFPVMQAVFSAGSYIQAIHRNPDGTVLRWKKLPVRVFVKPDTAQTALVRRAIEAWQAGFPVEAVSDPNRSDIVISWEQDDWLNVAEGLVTRPVSRVDAQKKPHTVILISLYPLRAESEGARLHALTHALGHALGLWGHSPNPADIMAPWLGLEHNDFPERWAWRSVRVPPASGTTGRMDDFQPTQRDIDTLLKIYDLPATDLKTDPLPL